ncbi:hypothetical protein [Methanolobus psychrotolerans]|uniref:hypothetical protein n=1 Tax=Methanolobus psychrotolerans TaxID=1874706 RepID=UPI000B91C3B6|nr:hypothetical protein [Methanolobus psychrotolerans]
MSLKADTVLFEDKFNVKISDFSTTEDVDSFVAKRLGKDELKIVSLEQNIVTIQGCVFPRTDIDIDTVFEKALKK